MPPPRGRHYTRPTVGRTLHGKYLITRLLGAGGMGSVYEATEIASGHAVAIKMIHAERATPEVVSRFEREARASGAITAQNIAGFLDAGTDAETGQPFLVMEYLLGEDVQQLLRRLGPVAPDLALRIAAQACVGLAEAHQARVVHRDIKPANLFLADAGGGERVIKILDFGIAKIRRDEADSSQTAALTQTGSMLGSPLYMSPEQARSMKGVDHRSDLWSLGVVLYQALAGRTPFQHVDGMGALLIAIVSEAPPPVQELAPWVAPEIAAILDRALQSDRAARYQSAAEMLDAIRPLLPGGFAIREEMLVPLDATARSEVAPILAKAAMTDSGSLASAATIDGSILPAPSPIAAANVITQNKITTVSGTDTSPGATRGRTSSFGVVALVAIGVTLGGAGVYALTRTAGAPAGALADTSGAPSVAADRSAPIASASAPSVTVSTVPPPEPAPSATEPPRENASPSASAAPPARAANDRPRGLPLTSPSVKPKDTAIDHRGYGDRK